MVDFMPPSQRGKKFLPRDDCAKPETPATSHAPAIAPADFIERLGDLAERAVTHGIHQLGEGIATRIDHLLQV